MTSKTWKRWLALILLLSGAGILSFDIVRKMNEAPAEVTVHDRGTAPKSDARPTPTELDPAALSQRDLPTLSSSLFGNVVVTQPVIVTTSAPTAPSKPKAPPLPYSYLGQYVDSDGSRVFYLQRGQELVLAKAGTQVDETYRLEAEVSHSLTFTYLPLKETQVIHIGNTAP